MSTSYDRALVALQAKLYKQAAECAKQHLQEEPGHVPSMRILASSLYLLNRLDESERALHALLALDANCALGYYLLACVYASRINIDETARYARKAVALEPDNANYVAQLARSELMKSNWQPGLDLLERALSLDPCNITALVLKAFALRSVGRFADAAAVTQAALKIDPECADLHQESGFIAMRFEPALAEEHFRQALRKSPNDKRSQKALREARAQNAWYYRSIRRCFKVDILLPYYLFFFIAQFYFADKHDFMPDKDYKIIIGLLLYLPVLLALLALFLIWLYETTMFIFGVDVYKKAEIRETSLDASVSPSESAYPYPNPSPNPSPTADPSANPSPGSQGSVRESVQSRARNAPKIVQFLKMNTHPLVWFIMVFALLRFVAALVQGVN